MSSASASLPPSSRTAGASDVSSSARLAARSSGKRSASRALLHANGRVASAASRSRAWAITPVIQRMTCCFGSVVVATLEREVRDELALSVGEHREEERVLRREVAVEGLVRQPGFLHDRADPGIDRALAAHDHEGGVDQAAGLGRRTWPGGRRRPGRRGPPRPGPARVPRGPEHRSPQPEHYSSPVTRSTNAPSDGVVRAPMDPSTAPSHGVVGAPMQPFDRTISMWSST